MSKHDATVEWRRQGADFDYKTYSRAHTLEFEGGILGKNSEGRKAMTHVTLHPAVAFCGRNPSVEEHAQLHQDAHHKCFIANPVKTEVAIEPEIA